MPRFALIALLALAVVHHCYGEQQVQMPETAELHQGDNDLQSQIRDLQRNVTDIWTYIHELRDAVSNHLNHLRQHQVVLETSMHKMEHLHESELQTSSDYHHHHSGEHGGGEDHHSHSGEHHSHSGEHHSHSGEHHSHSGEQHSHGDGDHHSHSGEHHSHGDDHGHTSHSHSHSSTHDHSEEAGHSHGEDHDHHQQGQTTDSVESEDFQQQTQQAVPVSEPVVVATDRRSHSHHRHSSRTDGMNLMTDNSLHSHHHHHHHDSSSRRRNRTVEMPKYSDYGLYDLAMCDVTPNRAIPEDQQQNVVGSITLWQKKSGGPLNLHVQLQGFDVEGHHGHHQSVQQEENNDTPPIGHKHGFHIHALGDMSNGCQSTGPHFNPKGSNHGGPNSLTRHVGDLGMISCDDQGNTNIVFSDDIASLRGPYSIIGKAIVIHALEDDLGQGGNEESLKTGNAGTRIACCLIRRVDKIPMRQHRVMKYAVQHQNR